MNQIGYRSFIGSETRYLLILTTSTTTATTTIATAATTTATTTHFQYIPSS